MISFIPKKLAIKLLTKLVSESLGHEVTKYNLVANFQKRVCIFEINSKKYVAPEGQKLIDTANDTIKKEVPQNSVVDLVIMRVDGDKTSFTIAYNLDGEKLCKNLTL